MGTDSEAEWGRFIADGTGTAAGDDLLGRMLRLAYPVHPRALGWIKGIDPSDITGRRRLAWQDGRFNDAMSDIMRFTDEFGPYRCNTISGLINLIKADENDYVEGMTKVMDTVESSLASIHGQGLRNTYAKSVVRMILCCPPHPGDTFQVAWERMILNVMTHGPGGDMGNTPLGTTPGPDLLRAIMEPSVRFAIEDMWTPIPVPVSPMTALLTMNEDGTVEARVQRIKNLEEHLQIAIASTTIGGYDINPHRSYLRRGILMPFGFHSLEKLANMDAWRAALLIHVPAFIGLKGRPIIQDSSPCDPSMTGVADSYIASTDWMAPPSRGRMLGTLSDMLTDPMHPCVFDNSGTLRKAMDSKTGITHGAHHHPPGMPADMLIRESAEDPDIMRSFMILNDLMGPVLAEHRRPIVPLSALIDASDDFDCGLPKGFVTQCFSARMLSDIPPGHRICAPRMEGDGGMPPFIIDIDS